MIFFHPFFSSSAHFKPNENRLINGTVTEIRNFPWQLSLRIRGGHVCGAIAVSATRALTAASCRDAHTPLNAYTILAGSTRRDGAGSGGFLTEVDHIIVHPLYNRITRVHDICVIWLDRGLPFGQNVRPVALPAEGAAVPYGARGYVSGWYVLSMVLQFFFYCKFKYYFQKLLCFFVCKK